MINEFLEELKQREQKSEIEEALKLYPILDLA